MRLTDSQNKQTALNIFTGLFTAVVHLAISFFVSPYIVSTMGEAANGFTQLANNFITYASLITLAFNSMAGRFMSVSYHQGNHAQVKRYYSSVIACNAILVALFLIGSSFVIGNLEHIIVIEGSSVIDVKILFSMVFANFLVGMITTVYSASLFVTNKLYLQNNVNLIRNIANAVLLLILFNFFPPKIYYISLAALILSIFTVPVMVYFHKKNMPMVRFDRKDFSLSAVKEMMLSGIWNTINQCGNLLMTGLDLLLCNLFINPATMGVLSVAKTVPNAIFSLATTLNTSLSPSLTSNWAKGDNTVVLKQLRSSMKISSVMVSIPIMTFTCFSVPFYELWMPTLDAKQLALLSFLTCMAMIPWAGPQALYNVFTATNRLKVNSIAFVTTGFLNVALVYLSLKYTDLGVIAVAGVSPVLSIIRNLVLIVPYTAKLLNFKWYTFYQDVLISLCCCATNAIIASVISLLLRPNNWLTLILSVAMTCLLTLVAEMLIVLKKPERQMLLKKLLRR